MEHQLGIGNSQQDVSTIFAEVKKEGEVQKIDRESNTKVLATKRKLKLKDRQDFKSALSKIQKFDRGTPETTLRKKRDKSSSSQIQKLSEDEKKSIKEYFEKFEDLDRDKTKFSVELAKSSRESALINLAPQECLSCVSTNLRTIGWTNRELNLFDKRSQYVQHKMLTHGYYSNNRPPKKDRVREIWGNWNSFSNPYRLLFATEQEWLSAVEKIVNTWDGYFKYVNSGSRIACSVATLGIACSGGKKRIEKAIDDSKASFELKIGSKLMTLMNQSS